jgi:hypothetical protein
VSDLDVRCPVCNRPVSIIGHNKLARHNNYNTRVPGTKWSCFPCKGSGADASELVAKAKQRAKISEAAETLDRAERNLDRARSDADKATARATKCLDAVTQLRAKLVAMQPDESTESEAPAAELVATLEVAP